MFVKRVLPANPTEPASASRIVTATACGSKPSFWKETVR